MKYPKNIHNKTSDMAIPDIPPTSKLTYEKYDMIIANNLEMNSPFSLFIFINDI